MSTLTNPTLAIAEYVHHGISFEKLPLEAIVNTKLVILDTIGVMFAGSRHDVGRMITDYVRANCATGPATVAGVELTPMTMMVMGISRLTHSPQLWP